MSNNKFVEVIGSTTTHGANWAYTTLPPSQAVGRNPLASGATVGGTRQRAAKNLGFETSAAKEAKIVRHLLELEKDNYRDVQIPVRTKVQSSGRAAKGKKPTANVRKILVSQKTFQNYLADEEALRGSGQPVSSSLLPTRTRDRRGSTYSARGEDEEPQKTGSPFAEQLRDAADKTGGPPLGYNNAKVEPSIRPRRHFCEICGYWGNYKCQKCGVRHCSIECGATHRETRCLKFYA